MTPRLLRRRPPGPTPLTPAPESQGPGKGRPTPTRAEARAARAAGAIKAKAVASRRARSAAARAARRATVEANRAAMRSTDPAKLPAAERAPEKVLARDVVDSQRRAGPLLMLALTLYIVGGFVRILAVQEVLILLVLLAFFAMVVDSVVLTRQLRAQVRQAYPGSTVPVTFYAIRRALLPRRWRLPVPRVEAGRRSARG